MNDQPGARGGNPRDPERALLFALRWALFPTLCVPFASASAASSAVGGGMPFAWAGPIAALALAVSVGCWLRVIVLWRALPRPGDDDQGWWRRGNSGEPIDPGGGGGGLCIDWARFEREFWSHVGEVKRQPDSVLVRSRCA